jgi:hypothetical protein
MNMKASPKNGDRWVHLKGAKRNNMNRTKQNIIGPEFGFKALALARCKAGLVLGLASALGLNTMALAANPEGNRMPAPSAPARSSTESTMPTPRPVDQAHVMADVGYHFANLWFAVENRNWPLAQYYLSETRSHLSWAVSIHPVRKTSAGAEVDLKGILDAVDNSLLSEVAKAIEGKDTVNFKTAYQQTLVGCYACHTACEKPFLRLQIPTVPAATIIDFVAPTNSPDLSSKPFRTSGEVRPDSGSASRQSASRAKDLISHALTCFTARDAKKRN